MPTLSTLLSFNGINGAYSQGGVIADAGGDLFGTTAYGGVNDYGAVFEIASTGTGYATTPTTLVSFNYTNGGYKDAGLTADAAEDLCGTTAYGGANGNGTVFELTDTGFPTARYCRGTRILTPSGEVPIEELSIGDHVVTLSGEAKPIRWIGHRAYDGRFVAGNPALLPILIRQDALADGVPRRDLYVSPKHAMFIDDVLVPAETLVNGGSILRCDTVATVEYFHLELDAHNVIFAEGATAETFVDCDNRFMFHNAHEFDHLYPDRDAPRWTFCAPRVEGGDVLAGVRSKLNARLEALGCTTTLDPALRLMVDQRPVAAESVDDMVYLFRLEKPPGEVRIVSRSSIPAEVAVTHADTRRLGVGVLRIVLRDEHLSIVVEHQNPALVDGFQAPEATHRWTGGDARIPEKFLACFARQVTIEVHVRTHGLRYRDGLWPGATSAEAAA